MKKISYFFWRGVVFDSCFCLPINYPLCYPGATEAVDLYQAFYRLELTTTEVQQRRHRVSQFPFYKSLHTQGVTCQKRFCSTVQILSRFLKVEGVIVFLMVVGICRNLLTLMKRCEFETHCFKDAGLWIVIQLHFCNALKM